MRGRVALPRFYARCDLSEGRTAATGQIYAKSENRQLHAAVDTAPWCGPYRQLIGSVPEPATWAMMILGLGVAGGAMRRRQAKVTTKPGYA